MAKVGAKVNVKVKLSWSVRLLLLGMILGWGASESASAITSSGNSCHPLEVLRETTATEPTVRLSQLLPACASTTMREHASRIRLGYAPLAGSIRILEGSALARQVAEAGVVDDSLQALHIPERIWVHGRPLERPDMEGTVRSKVGGHPLSQLQSRLQSQSQIPAHALMLVQAGERANLEIVTGQTRLHLVVICVEAGERGSIIRVRVPQNGNILRAQVLDHAELKGIL